eukprot:2829961-Pyramimonas_sp.AAC.1
MAGQVSPLICPWQGVVAGSSAATFDIQCRVLPVVAGFAAQGWGPSLDMRTDDFGPSRSSRSGRTDAGCVLAFLIDSFASELGLLSAVG